MNTDYVLEMKNISKQYGENAVLQGVSLSVKKGEIHALLGENGAGKSTLMNVLFGMPVIHNRRLRRRNLSRWREDDHRLSA